MSVQCGGFLRTLSLRDCQSVEDAALRFVEGGTGGGVEGGVGEGGGKEWREWREGRSGGGRRREPQGGEEGRVEKREWRNRMGEGRREGVEGEWWEVSGGGGSGGGGEGEGKGDIKEVG